MRTEYDPAKAALNKAKHGLDFADAHFVLESNYRMDVAVVRNGEARTQSVSYVMGFLAVLVVVHTARADVLRVISFRRASTDEREAYDEWLEQGR